MKLAGFVSMLIVTAFMFLAIMRLHPVGEPLGHSDVFKDRSSEISDIANVLTMDDYYLRNAQLETGANNVVSSVLFDYRALDTIGEVAVLFMVVASVVMLLFSLRGRGHVVESQIKDMKQYPVYLSRIISFGAFLMFPLIITFGIYLVVHGHISPGGGFQGGAVMASGTALLLVSAIIAKDIKKTKELFSVFESAAATVMIIIGFLGMGASFLYNFMLHVLPGILDTAVPFGPNPGFLNAGGIIPLLSVAIGIKVFCGLSIVLFCFYYMAQPGRAAAQDQE